ncbi:MAG TPA: YCF48-related protein, partial [Flavisolibacter sp.]
MRNWLLPLLFFAGFACNKSNDPDPTPIPEQPQQELNGWQKITTNTNDNFADIAFTTPAVGYLAGANGVYKSADSGKTWVSEPAITTRPVTINFMDQQYGYAVGQVSMQITRNGGSDWQRKQLTISNQAIDVCFISPAIGYLALQYGKILKTVDTGNTWQPIANFSNRECLSVFFLNEQ